MNPKLWRGVKVGTKLARLGGGNCFLAAFGSTTATVRFPNGTLKEMTHQQLYKHYKPV